MSGSLNCPGCGAVVSETESSCASCGLNLAGEAITIDTPTSISEALAATPGSWPASAVLVAIGFASVVLPAVAGLMGALITSVVPGCSCDTGAGCHGCGANEFVAFLLYGGFTSALGAVFTVFPACLVLALVAYLFSSRR